MILVVLMAVHNRVAVTLSALTDLYNADLPHGTDLQVVIVDSGSTDGTRQAIANSFPRANLVVRGADLYWAGAMFEAWRVARRMNPDYYLWLNDDTRVTQDGIVKLVETSTALGDEAIVGGSLVDPVSGEETYGGYTVGPWWHRLDLRRVPSGDHVQRCQALNGNLLLVPSHVDRRIGGFPSGYVHGMADFAYTLRASREGIEVVTAGGVLGVCARNSDKGTWADLTLSRSDRLRLIRSPKALPPRQWARYCLSFGGITGPLTFLSPYLKVAFGGGRAATLERDEGGV